LLQPWAKGQIIINPERVAPADATALRLNRAFNPVTQGSRSGKPWALRRNRFAVKQFKRSEFLLTLLWQRISLLALNEAFSVACSAGTNAFPVIVSSQLDLVAALVSYDEVVR
jgi:hypothetical protein